MDVVNENSNWLTTVEFVDNQNLPVTPTSVTYRIDDVGSLTQIRGDTVLGAPVEGTSVEIKWESEDTAIIDQSQPYELRRMTVNWTYLDANESFQEGNEQYLLQVRNLPGVPSPEELTT